jgi:hypothetical protein
MTPFLRLRRIPEVWWITLLGAGASLPAAAVINRFPNSEAALGGAVVIVGAAIAGAIAVTRSADPGTVGLRTGLCGGVIGMVDPIVTGGMTPVWRGSTLVFFAAAGGALVFITALFGWVFDRPAALQTPLSGRTGCSGRLRTVYWVAVRSRLKPGLNATGDIRDPVP